MPKWKVGYKTLSHLKPEFYTSNMVSIDKGFAVFYDEDINRPNMILASDHIYFIRELIDE